MKVYRQLQATFHEWFKGRKYTVTWYKSYGLKTVTSMSCLPSTSQHLIAMSISFHSLLLFAMFPNICLSTEVIYLFKTVLY